MKFLIFVLAIAALITAPVFSYLYWVKEYGFIGSLIAGFLVGIFLYSPISYGVGFFVMLFKKNRKDTNK